MTTPRYLPPAVQDTAPDTLRCHGCKNIFKSEDLNFDGYPLCEDCYNAEESQDDCPDCPRCIADGIGSARPL